MARRWRASFPRSLAGKKILLPRSERAGRDLPDALKAVGAEVTEVVAYHTGGVGAVDPEVMRAIREARVDVFRSSVRRRLRICAPSLARNCCLALGAQTRHWLRWAR